MIETNYEFCFIIIIGNKGYMLLGMKRAEIFIVHAYMSYITLFMISIANAKRTMIFFHKYNNYFFFGVFFSICFDFTNSYRNVYLFFIEHPQNLYAFDNK